MERLTGIKPTLGCSGKLKGGKLSEFFCCCGTKFDI